MQPRLPSNQSWHNQSPEKRPLKSRSSGASAASGKSGSGAGTTGSTPAAGSTSQRDKEQLLPDVYPQLVNQEEDKMSADRLTRGYQLAVPMEEYDSLMKPGSTHRQRLERLGDGCMRSAEWISTIVSRRSQLSVVALDKKRIRDGTFQNFGHASGANKQREYQRFFEELVRIKSQQRLVKILQQRDKNKKHVLYFPAFAKRREESLDYIYAFKVPLQKALWFLKISQFVHQSSLTPLAGSSTQQQQRQQQLAQKQQRSSASAPGGWELCAIDLTKVLTKYLRDLLRKLDSAPTDAATIAAEKQRWPYFAALYKHCFEEGCVDRMEFLSELADMLAEYMVHPWEKPYVFRLLVLFTSQFSAELTQSAWLARKVAFVLCRKLWMLKGDCEARRGAPCSASECLMELANCSLMRPIVFTSLGLLHTIIADCPVAMLFSPSNSIEHCPNAAGQWWLCGSPLDWLPVDESASADLLLTQHFPDSLSSGKEQLKRCLEAIRARSENIDAKWTLFEHNRMEDADGSLGSEGRAPTRDTFESLVDVCLNTLSALDQFSVGSPKAVLRLYKCIFCATPEAEEGMSRRSLLVRLRLLFQWAITYEREGSHRAYVVCQLLKMRVRHKGAEAFGGFGSGEEAGGRVEAQVQDLLLEFLAREGPRPASADETAGVAKGHFETEFANLMLLLAELQRHQLFSHDQYARELIRSGQLDRRESVMSRLGPFIPPPPAVLKPTVVEPPPPTVKPTPPLVPKSGTEPAANPAIISFIPTSTPSVSALSALSTAETKRPLSAPPPHQQHAKEGGSKGGRDSARDGDGEDEETAALPPPYLQPDRDHQLVAEPRAAMSAHERLLVHMPLEQVEEMRDASNQRASLLHGIASEQREVARLELKKLAKEICKLWQRRLAVEFFPESREVRMRRRVTREGIQEHMTKFHALSYHDQWVVAGWCADSLLEQINDFLQAQGFLLPTMESLDLVCGMMEVCQNLSGLVDFARELLPVLLQLDSYLLSFRSDLIPGHVCAQLGFVLVGYLAEHFAYFALQDEASAILNGLYRLVEKELCAIGYPVSGWARSIAVFLLHAKSELLSAQLNNQPLLGSLEQLKSIYPESGTGLPEGTDLKYNPSLLTDLLKEPKRFYAYNAYKVRLPSIDDAHTKYSFVVNALLAVKGVKRNFDALAELSTLCAHISAQKQLAGEWCTAVQELCYSSVSSKSGYSHLIREINVDDAANNHYPLATFIALLASKYAFSPHALLVRLVNNVFGPVIKSDNGQSGGGGTGSAGANRSFDGSEMGLCLALRVVAALLCGTDQPFTLPDESRHPPERLMDSGRRQITADLRALRVAHIREMDVMIAPVLSAIAILMDQLKRKVAAKSGNIHRLNQLLLVSKCTLFAVCEQEWVVQRIYRICESQPQLDSFNCARLRHNSIGHQLLRIALRRRCERRTKQQLMVCNGNSKKALFDKLLSAMTLWNMRATYFDLKLMIKEVTPDGSQKHVQQQAIVAEALICEIGKCCRDLFLVGERASAAEGRANAFRFDQIDCYWLMAPLIAACPRPENIPQTYNGQVTVKAKFLKEAANILAADATSSPTSLQSFSMPSNQDSPPSSARERLEPSSRLLAQQPFVNLVLTCVQGEDSDALVNTLLRHVQSLVQKTKDNSCYPFSALFLRAEREALMLRLDLVAGLFDTISATNGQMETWALAFFQLLQLEIVTPDREARYFQLCYDMLAALVLGLIASSSNGGGSQSSGQSGGSPSDAARGQQSLLRYPAYNAWVKKLRREMGDRPIAGGLQCLAQLLPLPKTYAEWNAWESFAQSPSSLAGSSVPAAASGGATAGGGGKGAAGGTQQGQSQSSAPWSQINTTAIRLDRQPSTVQRQLIRMLYHSHYGLFPQAGIVGVDSTGPDPFLSPPAIEYITDTSSAQQRIIAAAAVEQSRSQVGGGGPSPASFHQQQQQQQADRQQHALLQQQHRLMQAQQQVESAGAMAAASHHHPQQSQFLHPPVSQQMTVPAMEQQQRHQPSPMLDQEQQQQLLQQHAMAAHPNFAIPRPTSSGGPMGGGVGAALQQQPPPSAAKGGGRKKNPAQQQAGVGPGAPKGTKRKKEPKGALAPPDHAEAQMIAHHQQQQQARMMSQQLPGPPGASAMAMMGGGSAGGGPSMMSAHHQQQMMQQQQQQHEQQQYLAWQHQQQMLQQQQQQRAGMMAGGVSSSHTSSATMMHPHPSAQVQQQQQQPPLAAAYSGSYSQLSQAELMQQQQLKEQQEQQDKKILHNKILQRVQANQQQQLQQQQQHFQPQHQYQHRPM